MTISERIRAAQVSVSRAHSYTAGAVISPAVTLTSIATARRTSYLNIKLERALNDVFGATYTKNQKIAHILNKINPGYRDDGLSQSAISGAWKAEKYELELGGKGTANWTKDERQMILEKGRLEGVEGHHQQSVKYHSEEQANPDNIKFYKTREEHLREGHNGDFKNESDAPMYDRRQRLLDAKRRSVIKNEVLGASIVAVVSFITTAGLRFVIEMIKSNRNPEDVKNARNLALREGAEATGYALLSYGLGKLAIHGGTKVLDYLGIELSKRSIQLFQGGIAAAAIAIGLGVITYFRMRKMGYDRKESLLQAGKTAGVSFGIAMISLMISINLGMSWAIGVNVVIAVCSASYMLYTVVHEKNLTEQLQIFTIQEIAKQRFPIK